MAPKHVTFFERGRNRFCESIVSWNQASRFFQETLYAGCLKKFAIIRETVPCRFTIWFCFFHVSDKTRNKLSKDSVKVADY